MEKSKFSNFDK